MKKIIALVLALILTASGCALFSQTPPPTPSPAVSESPPPPPTPSPSPSPPPSPSEPAAADYFPFTGNVRMTYQGAGFEYAGFVSTVDYNGDNAVQLRTNNTGTETVAVYIIENGALVKVFSQGETYYRQDFTAMRTMREVVLPARPVYGEEWTLDDGAQCSITSEAADITVSFGDFTALEVTKVYPDSLVREYYAADFGLVKREYIPSADPASPIVSELSEYVAGDPAAQNVRAYYPGPGEQLVYVDTALEFYTGDAPGPKLDSVLKNPPPDSGLFPVLSAEAAVNGIAFDPGTGVVTVDCSGAFLADMRAMGSSQEGMTLDCLADTIGGYYQTDKVQLTVDGGPYESGHFLFNTGDFLHCDPAAAVPYAGA